MSRARFRPLQPTIATPTEHWTLTGQRQPSPIKRQLSPVKHPRRKSSTTKDEQDQSFSSDAGTTTAPDSAPVLLDQGEACEQDHECDSAACQDGHCCNAPCEGQCESCNVPGSVGECLPVTTPRTPCLGTGECVGYCTGTAQHRDECVLPSEETTCGAEASCTDSTFTEAATCNGAGECVEGGTMSCTFGCKSNGSGCASSCPNDQDLCDGSCVETESNPDYCGSSCETCEGETPFCFASECVSCVSAEDCSESGTTCKSNNTCGCGVGYHACGGTLTPCYSDTDVTRCGTECVDCRQANANAACGDDDACANTCTNSAFALACPPVGGKPNCSQWNFESDTTEGWQLVVAESSASAGPLGKSEVFTSGAALAIPYDNHEDEYRFITVRVQLCAGGNVLALSGKRIHWSFRMDPEQGGGYNYLQVYNAPNFGGGGGLFDFNTDDDGEWDEYDNELQSPTFDQVFGIGFHLQTTAGYSGTLYLDDIRIY